jgi:hypothetical protein
MALLTNIRLGCSAVATSKKVLFRWSLLIVQIFEQKHKLFEFLFELFDRIFIDSRLQSNKFDVAVVVTVAPNPEVEVRRLRGSGRHRKLNFLSGRTDLGDEDRKHVFYVSDSPFRAGALPVPV